MVPNNPICQHADPRRFACAMTSGSGKFACPGNDSGPHSEICDLATSIVEERDYLAAWNRDRPAEDLRL